MKKKDKPILNENDTAEKLYESYQWIQLNRAVLEVPFFCYNL